jgi:hypothetical protein
MNLHEPSSAAAQPIPNLWSFDMTVASPQTRTRVLEDTDRMVSRYLAQTVAGISPTLTQAQFKALVEYREAVIGTDNGAALPTPLSFAAVTV